MVIQTANLSDIPAMLDIYTQARAYQIKTGQATYPIFTKENLEPLIHAGEYFKIEIEGKIAVILFIIFEDLAVWDKLENNCSIYIHRIATHPDFKGRNLMRVVTDFAIDYAKKHNRQFVRMDTWNRNDRLKNYYLKFGFKELGTRILPSNEAIHPHHWGETCVFLELPVG